MSEKNWYSSITQKGGEIIGKLFGSVQASTPVSQINTGTAMYDILTGGMGSTGIHVTEKSAMAVSAVYACVGLIGGAISSMPFHLYKRGADGRERYDSDLWWLFNESPFDGWTAASAWSWATQSVLLNGDGFWQIHRASPYSNTIVGFEPLLPMLVDKYNRQQPTDPYPVYDRVTGSVRYVLPEDMLHFTGVGFDGLRSITPIRAALGRSAGIAQSADAYAGAFFENGARPDFALTAPGSVTEEQKNQLRETWARRHGGVSNAHLPAILAGGLDVKQLTMNAEDAQLLDTRQFQIEDIGRIFGVPAHMIGHTAKTTSFGSGVEQMSISFVRYTLGRHLDTLAQQINHKIWPKNRQVFGEFNRDSLLEGDAAAQAAYFSKALGGPGTQGWMTPNEVRKLKNLPPDQSPWANTIQQAGSVKGGKDTKGNNNP